MTSNASNPEEYITELPEDRVASFVQLRETILDHLPDGFREEMSYGMIGYVVPHSIYPDGYHCDPKLPLPFMSIASQRNYIAFYHSGLYVDPDLSSWFVEEYTKVVPTKIDMGKSCVRFKKPEQIPFALIGELVTKMSAKEWITLYEERKKR